MGGAAAIGGSILSLISTALSVFEVAYVEEPIFNALRAYQDGDSGYPPFIVLLHPIVAELLGTLAVVLIMTALVGLYALVSRRSGRLGLLGGGLMCLSVVGMSVYAAFNSYRMSVTFGGQLGGIYADPLSLVADLTAPLFVFRAP